MTTNPTPAPRARRARAAALRPVVGVWRWPMTVPSSLKRGQRRATPTRALRARGSRGARLWQRVARAAPRRFTPKLLGAKASFAGFDAPGPARLSDRALRFVAGRGTERRQCAGKPRVRAAQRRVPGRGHSAGQGIRGHPVAGAFAGGALAGTPAAGARGDTPAAGARGDTPAAGKHARDTPAAAAFVGMPASCSVCRQHRRRAHAGRHPRLAHAAGSSAR